MLAQTIITNTNIVPTMSGVTTALVLFILACLLYPAAVKNKTQFYAAFVAVVLIIFLSTLQIMIRSTGMQVVGGALTGLLQIFAFIMLFMCAGGGSVGELAGDLRRAYEVVRRGEEEKTVIIPLTGAIPQRKEPESSPPAASPGPPPSTAPPGALAAKPRPDETGSIPLE